jgi:RimJ/RimL family protein N-acetyltransferase
VRFKRKGNTVAEEFQISPILALILWRNGGGCLFLELDLVLAQLDELLVAIIKHSLTLKKKYIISSDRLGFRNWEKDDLSEFAKINADLEVMEHFPKALSLEESAEFIDRLQHHYAKRGFNYFAAEILETEELIGFIGLAYQEYESEFTPAVDIGWRLKRSAWGKGFATEGAKRCLQFGFEELGLESIISTCTQKNLKSEKVMEKIGMMKKGEFNHPKLKAYPEYEKCLCYSISKSEWRIPSF